jgi:DNA repair photolyase
MILREITCKSILSPSNIPGVDYAVNPYVGCGHGCVYCYATFMKRFTNHAEPWGEFVDVKVNAPERLKRDLRRSGPGEVLLSSVTDPYQPVEERYGVTRACLEILRQVKLPVSILTKSPLVLRDLDVLIGMREVDVGFTITTIDEETRALFEPGSSPVKERFAALRALSEAGIKTWIFFGPVLPYFSDSEEAIDGLLHRAEECGAAYVYVDRMNFYPAVWRGVEALLQMHKPDALPYYQRAIKTKKKYSVFLRTRVQSVSKRHAIRCRILF